MCDTRTRNIRAKAGPLLLLFFPVHKSGRAKALPALPLAPALLGTWLLERSHPLLMLPSKITTQGMLQFVLFFSFFFSL